MSAFTDYYEILGIEADASPGAIKAAFKKLALQYHPDVYKGEDAHERMRLILQAYQTLNDPTARRQYDIRRSEHVPNARLPHATNTTAAPTHSAAHAGGRTRSEVTPGARRDRQRHYDFPDFRDGHSVHIDLIDMAYTLSSVEASTLIQQGMLRGVAPETEEHARYCHRCRHTWKRTSGQSPLPDRCPKCKATDWSEYLLLRCLHCCAVFESEQIRYEVGTYTYGTGDPRTGTTLCPPYELFPLCPYCGTARWCPAEDARVHELRERAARHAARLRMIWIGVAVVAVVVVGAMMLSVLR